MVFMHSYLLYLYRGAQFDCIFNLLLSCANLFSILQVLDLIAFICASVYIVWGRYGGGWVQFVTISAFITTLVWFIFYLLKIVHRLPVMWVMIVSWSKTFAKILFWEPNDNSHQGFWPLASNSIFAIQHV